MIQNISYKSYVSNIGYVQKSKNVSFAGGKKSTFTLKEDIWGVMVSALSGASLKMENVITRASNPRCRVHLDVEARRICESKADEYKRIAQILKEHPEASASEVAKSFEEAAEGLKT